MQHVVSAAFKHKIYPCYAKGKKAEIPVGAHVEQPKIVLTAARRATSIHAPMTPCCHYRSLFRSDGRTQIEAHILYQVHL